MSYFFKKTGKCLIENKKLIYLFIFPKKSFINKLKFEILYVIVSYNTIFYSEPIFNLSMFYQTCKCIYYTTITFL